MTASKWQEDAKGMLWKSGTDGPYEPRRIPFTVAEILLVARALAVKCDTAALSTVVEMPSPGSVEKHLFPRSRTVAPRGYISEDFTEVSIATKIFTRKVAEVRAHP